MSNLGKEPPTASQAPSPSPLARAHVGRGRGVPTIQTDAGGDFITVPALPRDQAIEGLRFSVVDENLEAFNVSPKSLNRTTVRLNLIVDDPDAAATQGFRAGATDTSRWRISRTAFDKDGSPILMATTG